MKDSSKERRREEHEKRLKFKDLRKKLLKIKDDDNFHHDVNEYTLQKNQLLEDRKPMTHVVSFENSG